MSPQNLVLELGQRLGITLALDNAGLARLMIDNSLPIDFEHDEAGDRLLVYATICTAPSAAERVSLFTELLSANLFGVDLAGCAPALDSVRDELLLWCAFTEQTSIDSAMAALENLVAQAEQWRTRAARQDSSAPQSPDAPGGNFDNFMLA